MLDKWELKREMEKKGVFQYELAEHMQISEAYLSKKLRRLTKEDAKEIKHAIDTIPAKKAM